MASRVIAFLKLRAAPLGLTLVAVLSCLSLYRGWEHFDAQQRYLLANHTRLAEHFSPAELARMLPSSADLVLTALYAGIMSTAALALWTRKAA